MIKHLGKVEHHSGLYTCILNIIICIKYHISEWEKGGNMFDLSIFNLSVVKLVIQRPALVDIDKEKEKRSALREVRLTHF